MVMAIAMAISMSMTIKKQISKTTIYYVVLEIL
jgi:hypothetical protein